MPGPVPPAPGEKGYGYGPEGPPDYTLVWPDNARIVALWLLVLGAWTIWGWFELRGNACWICGRDRGLCRHTRDTHDSGGTRR